MKKHLFLVVALGFILTAELLSQVDTAWVRRYSGPGNSGDEARAMVVDALGNCYVTGYSNARAIYPYDTDYATIKYLPNGDTTWVRRYSSSAFINNNYDIANDLVLDNDGNLIVTGSSILEDDWADFFTIKYNPNGDTVWTRRYDAPGYDSEDKSIAIACDLSGNIVVTGPSARGVGLPADYLTIKYYPNGDTAWVKRYNGYGDGVDVPVCLAIDREGSILVTGFSMGTDDLVHILTVKYDSLGNESWTAIYNGEFDGEDRPTGLVIDTAGCAYICGNSMGLNERDDYVAIKYNPLGDEVWVRRYNGPTNWGDQAQAIVVDNAGNVIVTGSSYDLGEGEKIITIKYSAIGDTAWISAYDGHPYEGADRSSAIVLDGYGNVYIAGYTSSNQFHYADYLILKYDNGGNLAWMTTYGNPTPSSNQDYASAIALDDSGHVFVTGWSQYDGINYNYATIKYVQELVSACNYMSGDINSDGQCLGADVTYGVRYLKGLGNPPPDSCYHDSITAQPNRFLYVAADVNGNCEFRGSDITRLVSYFKGNAQLVYCRLFPSSTLP